MRELLNQFGSFFFGFALGLFLGTVFLGTLMVNHERNAAVAAGAAEYYLDLSFDKQFRWKTNHSVQLEKNP